MYSAEQIRNKVYVPDTSLTTFEAIEMAIILADYKGAKSIIRKKSENERHNELFKIDFEAYGYKIESVEFLGTKFWQISW